MPPFFTPPPPRRRLLSPCFTPLPPQGRPSSSLVAPLPPRRRPRSSLVAPLPPQRRHLSPFLTSLPPRGRPRSSLVTPRPVGGSACLPSAPRSREKDAGPLVTGSARAEPSPRSTSSSPTRRRPPAAYPAHAWPPSRAERTSAHPLDQGNDTPLPGSGPQDLVAPREYILRSVAAS